MREKSQIGAWKVQCYCQGKRDEVINDFKKLILRNWIQLVEDRKAWNDLVQKTKTIQGCSVIIIIIIIIFIQLQFLRPVAVVLNTYTGCNRRNGPDFGRVFLMLNYTDITQNTYIQS